MNVIIAGSRNFKDYEKLKEFCDQILEPYDDIVIFSGKASGADRLGERYAKERNYLIEPFPAPWNDIEGKPKSEIGTNKLGYLYWKKAGFFRNTEMAKQADMLIVFWNKKSPGTRHMIETAKRHNVETEIFIFDTE